MEGLDRDRTRHNRDSEPVENETPPRIVPAAGNDDNETDDGEDESRKKQSASRTRHMMARMIVSVDEQTYQTLIFQITFDELGRDVAPRHARPDVRNLV